MIFRSCLLNVCIYQVMCRIYVMHHCDRSWQYNGDLVSLKWAYAEDTKVRCALVEYIYSKGGKRLLSIIKR